MDVVATSILSGAHGTLLPKIAELLKEHGAEDILFIGGGVIPDEDIPELIENGVKAVFTPGTLTSETVKFIVDNVRK